jgi:pimeloyl-ACP methyl ester carboxylesterase
MNDGELFQPFVSFRESNNSLSFRAAPKIVPDGALTRGSSLLLLIHGYNDSMDGASDSYTAWRALQQSLGGISLDLNVAGVYWPGSNFENFLVYMQAIGKATETARRLAGLLREKASAFGVLRVRIVTHSLGGRLLFELLRELNDHPSSVSIESFVVMAAAVPTFMLQSPDSSHNRPLRVALDAAIDRRFRSLYSRHDWIVGPAIRLGETLRGEGWFPVALGSRKWSGPTAIGEPRLTQEEISGATHGSYWPSLNDLRESHALAAATSVRQFLQIGPTARDTPSRDLDSRDEAAPRETIASRATPSRAVPTRS